MKVLVVDDSLMIRTVISRWCERQGLQVVGMAADGLEGVEMFRTFLPDIVTLDITMPGMNGLDALEKMIEIKPSARIIVISSLADQSIMQTAIRRGAADFLTKPFSSEDIQAALSQVAAHAS